MNPEPLTNLTVDGLNIHDPERGVWIMNTNIWDTPEKEINEHEAIQDHGAIPTYQRFKSFIFEINGGISKRSLEEWKLELAKLHRKANKLIVDVVLTEAGVPPVSYKSIIRKVSMNKGTTPDFGTFNMVIWCGVPFAEGVLESSQNFNILTSTAIPKRVDTIFYANDKQHTATADIKPVINFTVNRFEQIPAFTAVDTRLEVGNPDNGRFLTFSFNPNNTFGITLNPGDVFRIDCKERSILRNGLRVYADGVFPFWDPDNTNNRLRFECNSDAEFDITFNTRFHHFYL